MAWDTADRAAAVKMYYREGSIVERSQRPLRRELGWRRIPVRRELKCWARRFEETGSVARATHQGSRLRISSETISKVKLAIFRNPRLSVRQLSVRTGVRRSTVHKILQQQLQLHPYKLQHVQHLKRGDKAKRRQFCNWAVSKFKAAAFRKNLFMTDEANFHLNGIVNKQNCKVWGEENPHDSVEREQYPGYVTVWCGVSKRGIIGPYFFQHAGKRVAVTGARYRQMLESFVLPALRRRHIPLRKVWFQQDGATPHTAAAVLAYLRQKFPNKVISKGGDVPWPPRSPDLSAADFFLWGHIKGLVYRQPLRSLRHLKSRIRAAVKSIDAATLNATMDSLAVRCRTCLQQRGAHIETALAES